MMYPKCIEGRGVETVTNNAEFKQALRCAIWLDRKGPDQHIPPAQSKGDKIVGP